MNNIDLQMTECTLCQNKKRILQPGDLCAVLLRVSECARLGQKPAAESEENVTRIQELCEIRGKR
jgi:hypothetical protein